MKRCKKIIGIILLILLLYCMIVECYAISYKGNIQLVNAQIKNYLVSQGYSADNYKNITTNNNYTKKLTWEKENKRYTATINLEKKNENNYYATVEITAQSISGAGPIVPIEDEEIVDVIDGTYNSSSGTTEHSTGEIISESNSFISKGENANSGIKEENLQKLSNTIYNILLVIGIVLAVIIGAILGIKFIMTGVEGQAEVKKALIPYALGCIVIFGAFTIWKIVVNILNII